MSGISLIYQCEKENVKCEPSDTWDEIMTDNVRKTTLGNILFLGVKGSDSGSPTFVMPFMNAPFGESTDNFGRKTLDLSVNDDIIRERMCSLTDKCKELIRESGIENAETIADEMLPILIESSGDHAPRIRVRMNGTESIKFKDVDESDTIPRGMNVRTIVEARNIWVSRNRDGSVRAGVGLYLHSALVKKSVQKTKEVKKDLMDYLLDDDTESEGETEADDSVSMRMNKRTNVRRRRRVVECEISDDA